MEKRDSMSKQKMVLAVSVLFFILLGLKWLNKDFLLWWNVNEIIVKVDKPLTREKVKITVKYPSLSSQQILFDTDNKETLSNKYGENDFIITYNNEFKATFRHFKFNRRHQHRYHFHLAKITQGILLGVRIDGVDKKEFQIEMSKIKYKE